MSIHNNKIEIQNRFNQSLVDSNREINDAKIIAVTKYVDVCKNLELLAEGISNFGENRVDKILDKIDLLKDKETTWHFIGSLQRRKVKDIINKIDYFHALDSIKLAQEIQKRAVKPVKCFLQVNISLESSKHGFLLEEVESAISLMSEMDKIELVGIMTMAPLEANEDLLSIIFSKAQELKEDLRKRHLPRMPFTELSMGMSNDFELALKYGATFVRIGTAFFK